MNLTNAIRPSRWWEWIVGKFARRHKPLGPRGEAYAARYLQKHGMRIIARNRRKHHGEIDLIAIDAHFLVFVEVRTRASEEFMTPERSVRFAKKRTVAKTVRQLMRKHRNKGLQPRIDLIAIIWPDAAKEPTSIRHHRAAIPVAAW